MHTSDLNAPHRGHISEIDMLRFGRHWLSHKDRAFLRMVLDYGSTFEQIARLTGESPSTVSRRFQRLAENLINRRLLPILKDRRVPDSRSARIIQEYYLRGQSQKAIARKFNISLYRIRLTLQRARAIAASGHDAGPASVVCRKPDAVNAEHFKGAASCTR